MKKRPVKSTNRLVTKKKRRKVIDPANRQLVLQIVSGVGIFAFVLLLVSGLWYGSRVSTLTLETITVEGGQTISHVQVQEAVAGTLTGNYFGLIPKRFAWTYPEVDAMAAAASIGRVKNPTVERISGTELKVIVDEYLPFALWCEEENEVQCYFIDKEGVAFDQAPVLDGGSMYRFYTLGDKPELSKVMTDKNTIKEIVAVADALESRFNLPITKIELDMVGDVFFRVVGGGEIKTTTKVPAEKLLENLALVLSTDDFKDVTAGSFQYIDLRFGSKVFVNDLLPEAATTTEEVSTADQVIEVEEVSIMEAVMEEVVRAVSLDDEAADESVVADEVVEDVELENSFETDTSTELSE